MSRENKYRAWYVHGGDDEKGEMIDGDSLAFEEYAPLCDLLRDTDEVKFMQYTGFNDDKGTEIYEGDIVNFEDDISTENGHSEMPCTGKVFWDQETGSWCVTDRLSAESYEVLDGECRVVGNIYENPDYENPELVR